MHTHSHQPSVTLFTACSLTKVYSMGDVEVRALRGVDLQIQSGEFIVLLGASGSGKSTLLNILGGLDTPTTGTLCFRDHDLTHAGQAELTQYRRQHVGFVFQFYNLIPSLTSQENVALVTDISEHAMSPDDALRLVGLGSGSTTFPRSCRVASSSVSPSHAPSPSDPRFYCATNPRAHWTTKQGSLFST